MYKVAFFSNQFAAKNGHGVARYAHNLLKGFTEQDEGSSAKIIPVATWSDREKNELDHLKADTGLRMLPGGRWLTPSLWLAIGSPKIERLLDFPVDLVHVNDLSYLVATSKPWVITVHDLGPLTHPYYFPGDATWFMQKSLERAIRKAAVFICVSHTTADALIAYVHGQYALDLSNRIQVVYEGISEKFSQKPDPPALDLKDGFDFLRQPFILAVGKISPRKNLDVVVRSLKKLQSRIPHHLVTVGGNGWDFQEVKSLVYSLGLADRVHFLGYVSDEQLLALYTKSTLFIYPSLFEGFGLPVLEAMAAGCPVITSNLSSLPEVAGQAAMLVDPHNVEEVAASIEIVCNNLSYANELRDKGRERASRFSWKQCAEETARVYSKLIC
jgi:glycosyltransferase involved in cell wall biosynthesis